MAAIIQNKKDGKVVSYKFKACVGRDELGKQVFKCSTWKVPDGMTPSKAEKAAQRAAATWEHQVKEEYKKDLENPERVREREIAKKRTDFVKFVSEDWFPVCIEDGNHTHTTVDFYRHTTNRITAYFAGRTIQSITAVDIQKFLIYLRTEYRTKQNKPVSDKTVRHSYCVLVMVFEFAVEQELIQKNPMDKVDCPKLAKKKVDAFSEEEAKEFLALLPACDSEFRCMMYPMSAEQIAARDYILSYEELPPQYDMVILNASSETGINIYGQVDYIVVHNTMPDTRTQVRGRYRRDLEILYLLDYQSIQVPEEYMNRELSAEEREKLCQTLAIRNENGRIVKWTTVRNRLIAVGYSVVESRKNSKRYYVITL